MKAQNSGLRVGILGGGQLARMLAQKGQQMGLSMHVLSSASTDPAAQVTSLWKKGQPDSEKDLSDFLRSVDVATFESEFLNAETIAKCAKATGISVLPEPSLIGRLQDRLTQKQALDQFKIKTSPWVAIESAADAQRALAKWSGKIVLKKRRFGYDGYGTFILQKSNLDVLLSELFSKPGPGFIAEKFIPFRRELAIMAVRNGRGQIIFLPLVESFQKDSRCLWVKGPVQHRGLTALKKNISKFLSQLHYQGAIAFELFDTGSALLVNEIAPRVHNSAHYSLDALSEDQFTLHLKAIINAPLATPTARQAGFAMYNLLGESSQTPRWTLPPGIQLHWYGKAENRPGRKMGHLNALATSPAQALARLKKARKEFEL